TYIGKREAYAATVTVNNRPLNPRLDLWNHSPTGFEWGYGGSGPAQLALALLADYFGNDEEALNLYQQFKIQVVADLPYHGWKLTGDQIRDALQALQSSHETSLHRERA